MTPTMPVSAVCVQGDGAPHPDDGEEEEDGEEHEQERAHAGALVWLVWPAREGARRTRP
jgi:hypothetical protein